MKASTQSRATTMWDRAIFNILALGAFCLVGVSLADQVNFAQTHAAFEEARAGSLPPGKALPVIDGFLETHANDPVATVYRGSVTAMMARDAWLPWRKFQYVNQAFDMLDQAVANIDQAVSHGGREPKLVIYMVSGNTNAQVPKMFGRRIFAERDFRAAITLPSFERIDPRDKATAYAWLAVFAADRSDKLAEHYMQLARTHDRATAEHIWDQR